MRGNSPDDTQNTLLALFPTVFSFEIIQFNKKCSILLLFLFYVIKQFFQIYFTRFAQKSSM